MCSLAEEGTVRVLIETLRLSKAKDRIEIEDIASGARVSESFTRGALGNVLSKPDSKWVSLSTASRITVALDVARAGRFRDAARSLTWQEFEKFGLECLEEAGFRTEKNVRVNGDGRAWQIDAVGFRGELLLSIDCKHWNTPGAPSRFKIAAVHQRAATLHLLSSLREKTTQGDKQTQALPVILTLAEPPTRFSEGVVLVSVDKLPSFLSGVTPYDENLPFISSPLAIVENPMSQSS